MVNKLSWRIRISLVFIHIGEKKIISDKTIIGIFNCDTLLKSPLNKVYKNVFYEPQCDIKTIVIDRDNGTLCSKVSPFTVIKRAFIDNKDCVWRKK
jgi:hypothetical protein